MADATSARLETIAFAIREQWSLESREPTSSCDCLLAIRHRFYPWIPDARHTLSTKWENHLVEWTEESAKSRLSISPTTTVLSRNRDRHIHAWIHLDHSLQSTVEKPKNSNSRQAEQYFWTGNHDDIDVINYKTALWMHLITAECSNRRDDRTIKNNDNKQVPEFTPNRKEERSQIHCYEREATMEGDQPSTEGASPCIRLEWGRRRWASQKKASPREPQEPMECLQLDAPLFQPVPLRRYSFPISEQGITIPSSLISLVTAMWR